MIARQVLDFWFDADKRRCWFRSTPDLDALIRERFASTWEAAREGRLHTWLQQADAALALVIVLDQMPLNMFRGQAQAFASEAQAREATLHAISQGHDRGMVDQRRQFFYLPLMHSERLADQDMAVELLDKAGMQDNLRWARHHREIVRRFGRFPHRNAILGRPSTERERAWLASEQAFRG